MAEQDQNGDSRLVVVGASAGGVEALTRLVAGLPGNFGAALLVVVHITPSGTSVLPAILSRAGRLQAVHAEDGMAIEPGRIYVAPPDRHILVDDSRLQLSHGPRENGHRPAIDPLFRTAARVFEKRTIGVVLSGTRDDGTAGMIEVRRRGGIGVAQDPADALFPSMPESAIARAQPEHVLDVPGIARLLVDLANGAGGNPGHGRSNPGHAEESEVKEPSTTGHADPTIPGGTEPPGEISALTCPECGGALWEIRDGKLLRYECHVGHAYSEQALIAEQNGAVEAALWTALRALRERAALMRRLSDRFADRGISSMLFEARADEVDREAAVLQSLIENVAALGDPLADTGAEGVGPRA
jgi:two-component system chemotaxis response regulator CheB